MDNNALQAIVAAASAAKVLAEELLDIPSGNSPKRHKGETRSKRRTFRPEQALYAIKRDYLGITGDLATPLFGAEFKLMFRVSRQRFQVLMEDVMAAQLPHFMTKQYIPPTRQASLEAKLLLPLKCLAYGVPPHAFIDYFQMSRPYARVCCIEFDNAIKTIYMREWLRLPTKADLRSIVKLHKQQHGVDGMVGSLDCSHTYWKNCPKAWQGSYKGKEKMPSIVLEAICDYNLFFWHASYGYTGNLNDRTILSLSPLMDRLLDGSFHQLEMEAGVIPFTISGEQFRETWITTDGIYPRYIRFVKGIKQPINPVEKKYTQWQEAVRKDVERAFGVLKGVFQFLERPILLMDLQQISNRVITCLILHNILVSDRVMGDCRVSYNPSYQVLDAVEGVEQPSDLRETQTQYDGGTTVTAAGTGISNAPDEVVALLTRADRFKELEDIAGYQRLHAALMRRFN